MRYVLEREGDVAAVIAEPARAVPTLPPPGFWQIVREACDACGTLLIFDEIPTGLGKTEPSVRLRTRGVVPDILVLGKALGGGVVANGRDRCRPELDVGQVGLSAITPMRKIRCTAGAALTTLNIIEEENLVENARRQGEHALNRLQDMQTRHPSIGDVRGRSLLLGVELVADRAAGAATSRQAVLYRALARGEFQKAQSRQRVDRNPPLVIRRTEMDTALDILESCIARRNRAGLVAAVAEPRARRRPNVPDLVIIGGGVFGLEASPITMLAWRQVGCWTERNALATAATSRAAALLTPGSRQDRVDAADRPNLRRYRPVGDGTRRSLDLRQVGSLHLAASENARELRELVIVAERAGLRVEWVSADEASRRVPWFASRSGRRRRVHGRRRFHRSVPLGNGYRPRRQDVWGVVATTDRRSRSSPAGRTHYWGRDGPG